MEDYQLFKTLTNAVPGLVWVCDENGCVEFNNAHWAEFTGMQQVAGLGHGWLDAIHPADVAAFRAHLPLVPQAGQDVQTEIRVRRHDGVYHRHLLNFRHIEGKWVGCAIDAHEWLTVELRDATQGHVLELLAAGADLDDVLAELCDAGEKLINGASCSILLVDSATGTFVRGVAPRMAAHLMAGVPHLKIGTGVGSCGTAAFEKRDVISEDIDLDPLWESWRELVSPLGYRACWSKPVFDSTGEVIASFGFYFRERRLPTAIEIQDLTRLRGLAATAIERAGMLDALRESEAHYRFTVEQSPQIPWTADPKGLVLGMSSRWTEMTGLNRTESLGNGWLRALHPDDVAHTSESWDAALSTGVPLDVNYRVRIGPGSYRWFRARAMPRRNESGQIVRWYGSLEDAHEQHLAAKKLKQQAYEDDLTKLPNRRSFLEELRNRLQKGSETVGLLVLDMDDFKLVNDRFGHQVGDAVLRLFGRYLRHVADPTEFVARLGGDEFAIICRSVTKEVELLQRASAIAERLELDLRGNKKSSGCKPSIGCALGKRGENPDDVFNRADMALYSAKAAGKGTVKLFDPMVRTLASRRSESLQLARTALRENWVEAFYQPVVSLRDSTLLGFEALLRVRHPQRGILAPAVIMDALDDPRMACSIGERMAGLVVDAICQWKAAGIACGQVALNLATENVIDASFATMLLELLDSRALSPSSIKLEITERVLLDRSVTDMKANLARLRRAGITISLDDFGTGYASLVHLQTLPIDEIKIDRSFVTGLGTNENRGEIVRAMLGLAKTMKLATVAEGIETPGEALLLTSWGCDAGQGYLFSRPLPATAVQSFVASYVGEANAALPKSFKKNG